MINLNVVVQGNERLDKSVLACWWMFLSGAVNAMATPECSCMGALVYEWLETLCKCPTTNLGAVCPIKSQKCNPTHKSS